jgi:hypothetical protein
MSYTIQYFEKHIVIESKPINSPIYLIMMIFMLVAVLLPVAVLLFYFANRYPLHLGLFFITGIFGLIAYYFYRLATWNKFGKEHFFIQNNQLVYKPEAKGISFSKVSFIPEKTTFTVRENEEFASICVEESNVSIQTKIKLNKSDAQDILTHLNSWKTLA